MIRVRVVPYGGFQCFGKLSVCESRGKWSLSESRRLEGATAVATEEKERRKAFL